MKISIVTPTFNSEIVITGNINSILNQSYKNFEQIIIDNESNDNTLDVVKSEYVKRNSTEKLQILSEKDNGIADAFNKGIKSSTGEIIGILNSDDKYFDNDVLKKVVICFADADILFVHGNIYFDDKIFGSNIRKPLMCRITNAMPYNHPAMFFRREAYTEHGYYDLNYKYAMDFELVCRFSNRISGFKNKGVYLNGDPLVSMKGGGASWKNEMESLIESRIALKKYNFWNFDAKKNFFLRKIRIRVKQLLIKIKLGKLVYIWRKHKWKN